MTDNLTEKQFFDWMRSQQDDQRLSQDMVDGANKLLACMTTNELKDALTKINGWGDNPTSAMQLSLKGIEMINQFEGFRSAPYRDAVGKPTIGFGSTYYPNGRAVKMSDPAITKAQAHELKQAVINQDFAPAVNLMFADEIAAGKISQNQFDALISLAYNIGVERLKQSSIYDHLKAGNYQAAANSFLAYNKGRINGKLQVLKGLVNRREAERNLFLA